MNEKGRVGDGPEGEDRASPPSASPTPPARSGPPSRPPPARPTPVRDLMARDEEPRSQEALRELEDGDETWFVGVGGVHRTGTAPDRGATLLLLFFQRSRDMDVPDREGWAPARTLAELPDEALLEALARSRPYRAPEESPEPEAAERRRRRGPRKRQGG